jgi:mono/diheme cytochrome c family protein
MRKRSLWVTLAVLAAAVMFSGRQTVHSQQPALVDEGRQIFRFDTFGDERFWTDILLMNEVIETAVDPTTALSVGLKVDADAVPPEVLATADLKSPATTVALLKLNAVVGLKGTVVSDGTGDRLERVGITCALCHSTVDDSVMPGIGHRLDGWPNLTLNPGAIIALSPVLTEAQRNVYRSWGAGRYDPRFNIDGKSGPVPIPPAYGLAGSPHATFTGDGDISYWNNYVAVTQMGGQGEFVEPRLGIEFLLPPGTPDLVKPKLPALRAYQLSLAAPPPPSGSFDPGAAGRGRAIFMGGARCGSCHRPPALTEETLHEPAETRSDPAYALRSASKRYRTTPLRGLWQHAPYFHDGSAATLEDVVERYRVTLGLTLTPKQRADLVEYLKSL